MSIQSISGSSLGLIWFFFLVRCPRFHMGVDEGLAPRHPIRLHLLLQRSPHIMSPLYDYPIWNETPQTKWDFRAHCTPHSILHFPIPQGLLQPLQSYQKWIQGWITKRRKPFTQISLQKSGFIIALVAARTYSRLCGLLDSCFWLPIRALTEELKDVGLSTSNIVPKKNGNETKDMLLLELGPIALEVARRKPGETPSNSF